jgi:hypothetical protein
MVISFMVAAPFSLGFCRRLIRLDRGVDLIGRSRSPSGEFDPEDLEYEANQDRDLRHRSGRPLNQALESGSCLNYPEAVAF